MTQEQETVDRFVGGPDWRRLCAFEHSAYTKTKPSFKAFW